MFIYFSCSAGQHPSSAACFLPPTTTEVFHHNLLVAPINLLQKQRLASLQSHLFSRQRPEFREYSSNTGFVMLTAGLFWDRVYVYLLCPWSTFHLGTGRNWAAGAAWVFLTNFPLCIYLGWPPDDRIIMAVQMFSGCWPGPLLLPNPTWGSFERANEFIYIPSLNSVTYLLVTLGFDWQK